MKKEISNNFIKKQHKKERDFILILTPSRVKTRVVRMKIFTVNNLQ